MKTIPCSYANCGDRRPHWERPDEKRGARMLEVEDDEDVMYCSITCAVMAGAMSVREPRDASKPLPEWLKPKS